MKRLLSLAGLLVAIPSLAFAVPMQTEVPCESDADCAKGELCMLTSGGCPPCEPGTDCEPCDVGTGEMFCVPDPSGGGGWGWSECETDADCPSNYVCNEISVGCANGGGAPDCACPTCAEGEECEPCDCKVAADPMPCEEETAHVCEPAPCSTDADCGEGWECLPIEECWGGSSAGCGCACPACEPGAECPPCECEDCPEPSDPPEYQCETVGSYCSVKPVECMDDSECPDGSYCAFWSDGGGGTGGGCACGCDCAEGEADCECPPCDCGDEPVSNGTSTDAGGPSSDGARDNAGARAEEPQPDEDQAFAPAVGMCVSTDYYGGGTGGGGIGAEYPQEGGDPKGEGGGGDNGATSGPGTSNDGNGAGVGGEGSGSGEGTGGTGSGEGTGGTGGDGTVEGTFSGSAGDSDTQTGCSAASGSANAGALALLVLMLAFALAPLRRERVR